MPYLTYELHAPASSTQKLNGLASYRTSNPGASVRRCATPNIAHAAPDIVLCCQPLPTCIPYGTLDLLLKHLNATVATYKGRQMKHSKQAYETLTKMLEKNLKTIANICNIQTKHLQTYV
jgi:hypothetical protein